MALTALLPICALGTIGFLLIRALYFGLFCDALSSLPGPWYSKYTHYVLKFYILTGRRIYYVDNLHRKYGSVVRIAPNEVVVSDLEGYAKIHKIGSGFLKSKWYDEMASGVEPGIFFMRDPHAHAGRRRLFAQAFSNSALQRNWTTEIHAKAEKAVARIKADAIAGEADIMKWWTLMATDVIAHLSFGESFNMLELGKVRSFPSSVTRPLAYFERSKHRTSMLFNQLCSGVLFVASFHGYTTLENCCLSKGCKSS
jgi:hypothetical protein